MEPATKREHVPEEPPEEPLGRLQGRVGRSSGVRPVMRRDAPATSSDEGPAYPRDESSLWPLVFAAITVVALFGLLALVAATLP